MKLKKEKKDTKPSKRDKEVKNRDKKNYYVSWNFSTRSKKKKVSLFTGISMRA